MLLNASRSKTVLWWSCRPAPPPPPRPTRERSTIDPMSAGSIGSTCGRGPRAHSQPPPRSKRHRTLRGARVRGEGRGVSD